MIVLGIDPGSQRCGYGIVARDADGRGLTRLASGVIEPGALPMAERLGLIYGGLTALLASARVELVAVESAFCGRSPSSALALGQARGVAIAAAAQAGLPVVEFAPAEVKRAFTGHGRAEKDQMVHMARALFGFEPRKPDEADALAVAVCCLAHQKGIAVTTPARLLPRGATAVPRLSVRRYGVAP